MAKHSKRPKGQHIKPQPPHVKMTKGSVLILLVITLIVVAALFWLVKHGEKKKEIRLAAIKKHSGIVKGVIADIHYHKGRTVEVKYTIKGIVYKYGGGWDINPDHKGEGDSVLLLYAIENPELAVTELENEFKDF